MKSELAGFSPTEIILLEGLSARLDYLPPEERPGVMNAAKFMMTAFSASKIPNRDSGTLWASHSIRTMEKLAEWRLPPDALKIGGLHDTVEDTAGTSTPVNLPDLSEAGFSPTVVDGVARLGIVKKYDKELAHIGVVDDQTRDQELLSQFYESLLDNPFAFFARVAERFHNLEEIDARYRRHQESAKRSCRETLKYYLPVLWELGMYDVANTMAKMSLNLLFALEMKELDSTLPVFDDYTQRGIKDNLKALLGDSARIAVYPPSYTRLAELMMQAKPAQRSSAAGEPNILNQIDESQVPLLVDIIVSDDRDVGRYVDDLIHSHRFYPNGSWSDYLLDRAGSNDRPYVLSLTPKHRRNIPGTPMAISILNEDQLMRRSASVLHLYQVGEIDPRWIDAAREKLSAVKQKLRQDRSIRTRGPSRGETYLAAVQGTVIDFTITRNNQDETRSARRGSTVLDVLTEILSDDDLCRLSSVSIGGRKVDLSQPVRDMISLEFEIDENIWHIHPSWLKALKKSSDDVRRRISMHLHQVVNGEYQPTTTSPEQTRAVLAYQQEVIQDARAQGEQLVATRFKAKAGVDLNLRISFGYEADLMRKYGDDIDAFLIDAGIGMISDAVINHIINNLIAFRNSLIPVRVYVPKSFDLPGWQLICAEVFDNHHFNIRESAGGGSNRTEMGAELSYLVQPPYGIEAVNLPRALEELRAEIVRKCEEKFGGGLERHISVGRS